MLAPWYSFSKYIQHIFTNEPYKCTSKIFEYKYIYDTNACIICNIYMSACMHIRSKWAADQKLKYVYIHSYYSYCDYIYIYICCLCVWYFEFNLHIFHVSQCNWYAQFGKFHWFTLIYMHTYIIYLYIGIDHPPLSMHPQSTYLCVFVCVSALCIQLIAIIMYASNVKDRFNHN